MSLKSNGNTEDILFSLIQDRVLTGEAAIQKLLASTRFSFSPILDPNAFSSWARDTVNRKYISNLEFKRGVDVRELRKKHASVLDTIEKEIQDAEISLKSSVNYDRIMSLEKRIKGFEQAIESMRKVLSYPDTGVGEKGVPEGSLKLEGRRYISLEQYKALQQVYPNKIDEYKSMQCELSSLIANTSEYQRHKHLNSERLELLAKLGLDFAIDAREKQRKLEGRHRHTSGFNFEDVSSLIVNSELLPLLSKRHGLPLEQLQVTQT
jgi:hypothetical protein